MIFVDELKNMTLYKKPFFLPINEDNKRKGAATFLLTPDYNSSNKVMNLPYIIKRYYEGYYIEKDITYFINQENALERPYEDNMVLNESDKINDKGEKVPEECTECGSKIGVFFKGEPVYLCTKCNKYYGTVPFKKESADILNEFPKCTLRCSLMSKYKVKGIDCRVDCDQYKKRILNEEV